MGDIKVYFSDYFDIEEDVIESYGAVNISLINDLPLFIDPFLLFNSTDSEYQKIHHEMIDYLLFLQGQSEKHPKLPSGMRKAWYSFSEVKQTWLGFSLSGNAGRGMGSDFAVGLHAGLNSIFKDFGRQTVTKGRHMEKLFEKQRYALENNSSYEKNEIDAAWRNAAGNQYRYYMVFRDEENLPHGAVSMGQFLETVEAL